MPRLETFKYLVLALLALSLSPSAQSFSQTVPRCPFSITTNATSINVTAFVGGQLSCSAITTNLVLPNATSLTLTSTSCGSGLHQYVASAPAIGVYTVTSTTGAEPLASCSFARLRGHQTPPEVPDMSLPLVLASSLLALGLLRARFPSKP